MNLLKGKRIFITGAGVRIGRSLSLAAAREGADLTIHYHQSKTPAEQLSEEVQALGRSADIVQADFSSPEKTKSFAEALFQSQEIDAVINNASVFFDLDWNESTIEDWTLHQHVNLTAPFLISQAFARTLPAGRKGRIVNMLDWRALRPGPDHFPYTISKAGLAALTRSLAISLGPNITVNGIALGAILPPSDGGEVEDLVSGLPNPRWADLAEVEDTLLFLLSGPDYITGEIIHLDGGRHLI